MAKNLVNLEQLLIQITKADSDHGRVSFGMIVEAIGSRSFGPLLLLVGIILTSPLSGIPGMPTTMAFVLLIIAFQLLIGKRHFWLPSWILKRSMDRNKLNKAVKWLKHPARFIDRLLQPRLQFFINRTGIFSIAVICLIISVCLPVMELVPFSATGAGITLAIFGLSIVSNDGFLAMMAFVFTAIIIGLILYTLIT